MNANTGKTYYKEERKQIKVVSKTGRTYYRYPKTKKCIDCNALINEVSTRCMTCTGAKRQSNNMDRAINGEEYDRSAKVL